MKGRPWLIIDATWLSHRAGHSTGHLRKDAADPTGVIYGFFASLVELQRRYQTGRTVFCFDVGAPFRCAFFAGYKSKRREEAAKRTPQEKTESDELHAQMRRLRKDILPRLGYRNVFGQRGYEADDLIAETVLKLSKCRGEPCVVVGSDRDLLQLIDCRTVHYNATSKKETDLAAFREEWGVLPRLWAEVKAIAGCSTDSVPGVRGCGEKTAARWIAGELPKTHKIGGAVEAWVGSKEYARNLGLVRLPYSGVEIPVPREPDRVTRTKWREVVAELGMPSLRDRPPMLVKVKHKKD